MTVTPEDACKVNSEKEKAAIIEAEKVIDEALRKGYVRRGSVGISKQAIFGKRNLRVAAPYRGRVETKVKEMYEAAGWHITVEHSNDPRDGGYTEWVFKANPPVVIPGDGNNDYNPYEDKRWSEPDNAWIRDDGNSRMK